MDVTDVIDAIQANRVRVADHTDEEAKADRLTLDEVYFSALHGEIIEDYPTDRPYPSCLVYGQTFKGDPVHSVWAYNEANGWAVLIAVYRTDPNMWIDWRERWKQ